MSVESEIKRAIDGGFDIEIKYEKYDGETSRRVLSNVAYNNGYEDYGYNNDHIRGFCHLRGEDRTFRISRILAVRVLPSGAWVSRNVYRSGSSWPGIPYSSTSERSYSYNRSPSYSSSSRYSSTSSSRYSSSSSSSGGSSGGGGCYIATMAYGSYDHPQVMVLRWYRNNVLQKSCLGRLFVRVYYFVSPKLVALLGGHESINRLIRRGLDRLVQRIRDRRGENS